MKADSVNRVVFTGIPGTLFSGYNIQVLIDVKCDILYPIEK